MIKYYLLKQYPKYEISKNGDVRNRKTKKILKTRFNYKGYKIIDLSYDKGKYIHNLVFYNFNDDKPKKGYEIDHIDGNILNNNVENLQQITKQHNQLKGKKPTTWFVVINKQTKDIMFFKTSNELKRTLNVPLNNTINIVLKSKQFKDNYTLVSKGTIKEVV